jgi:filamentous hemagglutinin family protein
MKLYSWKVGFFLIAATATVRAGGSGISFDNSMGPGGSPTGPNYIIPASMGTQRGGNLFHSFSQFNLLNGETADFTATGSTGAINNIIARVTGGNASSIDGTIESSIAGANLFLLNPSGVMFGPNAKVNVTGAFSVGSPDYVKFADGTGKFNTSLGGNDVLTSANVSAFGFLSTAPRPVQFSHSNLSFAAGSNVSVISGDITLDRASLLAPDGKVSFFSARSSGELPFDPSNPSASFGTSTVGSFGNVTFQNGSKVAIDSAQGGGQVMIRGGAIVFQNTSQITSINSGSAVGGSIEVDAQSLSFFDNSNVLTSAASGGAAGNIDVTAQNLTIDGSASPSGNLVDKAGLASDCNPNAGGNAGNITATVAGNLSIKGGGEIATETFSTGAAGNIKVQTLSLSIDGSGAQRTFTGITSSSQQTIGSGMGGDGGLVSIEASGGVSIIAGGAITADTFSKGQAGDVDLRALSLAIDGSSEPTFFTGISSASDRGANGNGGAVDLTITDSVSIKGSGAVSTATAGAGDAGDITLQAANLTIDSGSVVGGLTGIASQAEQGSTGKGGNINLNIRGQVELVNAGEISADTTSSQPGGDVLLHAGSLTIDGSLAQNNFTGISSSTGYPSQLGGTPSRGQGGNLTVNVDHSLNCTGGGGIEEESFSNGNAGTLNVTVGGTLSLTNGGFISGDTFANGIGGSVTVTAPSIYIDASGPDGAGAVVETLTGIASDSNAHFSSSGTGDSGSVLVTASDSLTITNGGRVAALTETGGNGGDVMVNTAGSISLANAAEISAASSGTGTAGSVTINVGTLELNDASSVATSAVAADAGSIDITAANKISIINGSSITTSAAANGGSIDLKVAGLVYLLNSDITATAGKLKQAGSAGSGGNITIDPQFVVLDDGLISANAAEGQGGNILIITNDFLNTHSMITATGSTDGTITISAPNLDLSGSLLGLPNILVNNEDRLRGSCARAINHEFSSLIVVGRGGTEASPEELQSDFGLGVLLIGLNPVTRTTP